MPPNLLLPSMQEAPMVAGSTTLAHSSDLARGENGDVVSRSTEKRPENPAKNGRVLVHSSSFAVSIDYSSNQGVEVGRCDEMEGSGGGSLHNTSRRVGSRDVGANTTELTRAPASAPVLTVSGCRDVGANSTEPTQVPETPSAALDRAERLHSDDRLLEAARVLRSVDPPALSSEHRRILSEAESCEALVADLKSDVSGEEWKKQGESHGHRHSVIYYKLDEEKQTKFTARIETPIERSLLVPILSVLNETELYSTWLPNWAAPRLRVRRSVKLRQTGRCSQVLVVTFEVPWPLDPREVVIKAVGFDDIDASGDIAIKLDSLQTGDEDGLVPPPEDDKAMRVDFQGGFLFRRCPPDHPALRKRRKHSHHRNHLRRRQHHHHHDHRGHHHQTTSHKQKQGEKGIHNDDGDNDLILVSFTMFSDAIVAVLPPAFMNFIIRTAMGSMWNKFLKVAEDVRDGKRPKHAAAIRKKRETLYAWVEERVCQMFSLLGSAVSLQKA